LGQNVAVERVEIHWPSGAVERLSLPSVDRFYVVEEGKGIVPSLYDRLAQKPQNESLSGSDKGPAAGK